MCAAGRPKLLVSPAFLPLFLTQALGALVDNLFRNALIVLVLFRDPRGAAALPALAGLLFILPYILFSAPAGALADRLDKARLIRWTKLGELALMLCAAAALLSGSAVAMLAILFGLGVQATFFGPVKYAILPQILPMEALLQGNALVESATFVAILVGSAGGGLLAGGANGALFSAVACVLASLAGLLTAWRIPPAPSLATATTPTRNPNRNPIRNPLGGIGELLHVVRERKSVWHATLAVSWFWTIGAVLLAQIPLLAAVDLHANGRVAGLLVGAFTLGIGLGSMLAPRLRRAMHAVPWAGIGITLACGDLAWAASAHPQLPDVPALLGTFSGWRILLDLVLAACCGGVFSVPLYAGIQAHSAPGQRARSIAAGNIVNALGMAGGSGLAALAASRGVGPVPIVLVAAAVNLGVSLWTRRVVAAGDETETLP
jgi:acyl-[acyl-carrier-protein]-phospholipid O-acyltransferase / long-chain-fatty-acid--[acyl-carrier-protein] ligase